MSRGRRKVKVETSSSGREVKACAKCTQKCTLLHGKRNKSTPCVSSFFKVMVGSRFSEVMFIPPKFAPMLSSRVGKDTFLEDSSGLRWKVKLSYAEGSLAICEGWSAFASDHGLSLGDFVVFAFIARSYFVVQIWDTTGCEKPVVRTPPKRGRRGNKS